MNELHSTISFISAISRLLEAIRAVIDLELGCKNPLFLRHRSSMPRRPQFKILKTKNGWQVNVPAGLTESGKRERHFHGTRDKAKEHAAALKEKYNQHGEAASIVRPSLAEGSHRRREDPSALGCVSGRGRENRGGTQEARESKQASQRSGRCLAACM
jgi:hypothetical protein